MAAVASFASPWEYMPSELITCLEGPIKLPLKCPQTKEADNRRTMKKQGGETGQ